MIEIKSFALFYNFQENIFLQTIFKRTYESKVGAWTANFLN